MRQLLQRLSTKFQTANVSKTHVAIGTTAVSVLAFGVYYELCNHYKHFEETKKT